MKSLKEEAVARLALACLVLIAIWFSLITFLMLTQSQILTVVNGILTVSASYALSPMGTLLAVSFGIDIFAGTNLLVQLGVVLNDIFFGSGWYYNYSLSSFMITYLIQALKSLGF
jgi:hypothetical protein